MKQQFNIRLDSAIVEDLRFLAEDEQRSVTSLVTKILKDYVKTHDVNLPERAYDPAHDVKLQRTIQLKLDQSCTETEWNGGPAPQHSPREAFSVFELQSLSPAQRDRLTELEGVYYARRKSYDDKQKAARLEHINKQKREHEALEDKD